MASSYMATRKLMYHFYVAIKCLNIVPASNNFEDNWHKMVDKHSYDRFFKNGVKKGSHVYS
jgi:hypothetical protein